MEDNKMKLNIYIDGSWLFRTQAGVLANARIDSDNKKPVYIDFAKLSDVILKHVQVNGFEECLDYGERHCCISVFNVPSGIESKWENKKICDLQPNLKSNKFEIKKNHLDQAIKNCKYRDNFSRNAIIAGFDPKSVIRPDLKPWMIEKLVTGNFQEKQVDTTLVALIVSSAITRPDELHAVVAGDADILPAIQLAYPKFSENVFMVTTHPDELKAEHRQSSFSYQNTDFKIEALYLQDHVKEIALSSNLIECQSCRKLFEFTGKIDAKKRTYCTDCNSKRT